MRTLVIGLDGYEDSLGERMMAEGRLAAIRSLSERGAVVHLDHGSAKRTGLAWEHFSTGLDPRAAGRWSAVEFDPATYRVAQRGAMHPPFLGNLPVRSVVFDIPYFDLAACDGARGMVSWGAHDPGVAPCSAPASLRREIEERFGEYPAKRWIYGFAWPSVDKATRMGAELVDAVNRRAEISEWLLAERFPDWEVGITVVSELHSVIEGLWHGIDPSHRLHALPSAAPARDGVRNVYEATDALVARLVKRFPDSRVLMFSMHGMGSNDSDVASMALLPELLFRRQFRRARLDNPDKRQPGHTPILDEEGTWGPHVRAHVRTPDRTPGASLVERAKGKLATAVARTWRHFGPSPNSPAPRTSTNPIKWQPTSWYADAWPQMDAFALPSFYDGQVRVNLAGRERHGTVAPENYDDTLSQIEALLDRCVDPATGRPVVREMIRNRRTPPLARTGTESDLVVVWAGGPLALEHPDMGIIGPFAQRRPGGHTGSHGIAWLVDERVRRGFHGTRSAFDVAPTLIDLACPGSQQSVSGQSFLRDVLGDGRPARARG